MEQTDICFAPVLRMSEALRAPAQRPPPELCRGRRHQAAGPGAALPRHPDPRPAPAGADRRTHRRHSARLGLFGRRDRGAAQKRCCRVVVASVEATYRYSSPQSPITCIRSRDLASTGSIAPRSSASSAKSKTRALSAMCSATPEPGADDDAGDRRASRARSGVATLAMLTPCLSAMRLTAREQFLEQRPAAPGVDHVACISARRPWRGSRPAAAPGRPRYLLRQQPAEQGAVGEQR